MADVADDGGVVATLRDAYATALAAKDSEIVALRDQLQALQAANDGQISLLREELDRERTRSDRLEADLNSAQEAVRRAENALDRYYEAENERQGRGRWRRLRAAWRGE